ncbi:Der1-like family protein [Nitzschia inconspicua]|uniref:Derlin n=1 Tax=Nitzschia inconspicua TaxID=303405 RepID=A0A9K3L9E0_9STRA|nr:Der1-like family protein [Nitzschia inconspicua]
MRSYSSSNLIGIALLTPWLLLDHPFFIQASIQPRHRQSPSSLAPNAAAIIESIYPRRTLSFLSKNHGYRSPLEYRGGALYEDSDDEEEEDSDEEEEDAFLDTFQEDDNANDFKEENGIDRAIGLYYNTPPLTKAYVTASCVLTLLGYLTNGNQFPSLLTLDWPKTLKLFQIWRPFTTFLNFGPFGLGYAMSMHFVWTYMSELERMSHNKPYDFWIMILFGMMSMLAGYSATRLDARFLGHNLSTFLVYVWSRTHEGVAVNMFGLFMTRAELLPYFFIAQTFLLEGELPWLDFLGILFGHIYFHLKTTSALRAPEPLITWYEQSPSAKTIREKYKAISSDFEIVG